MSVYNAKISGRRAVVLADTGLIHGACSKLIVLPHLPAVVFGRGGLDEFHDAAAIINDARAGDVADLDVRRIGDVLRPIADNCTAAEGPNRMEFYALGYSRRQDAVVCHMWNSRGTWAETLSGQGITLSGPSVPFADDVVYGFYYPFGEPSVDDALAAYRHQHAELAGRETTRRLNFGGAVTVAEIDGDAISLRRIEL